jgi:two-component system OmpR family sensor kinase
MLARLPIRLRLTLVFALAMAAVLAGAGWLVYQHVASDLKSSLDQQLRSRAQDVSALVRRDGSLASTGGALVEHGESFAELLAPNGTVLDATDPIGRSGLLSPAQLTRARTDMLFADRVSVPGLNEGARMLALPIRRASLRLVLVVGTTKENNAETLQSVLNAFLIGGPLALVLASLAGYALAGAALRPIEAMRRRAADISASSLDERLPVPQTQDEVSRLGETLNEMLTRIADGLARERRFVADASHELRTPLALLKTELELALRRARSREELEASVRAAAEDTERLSRIADDLLLLARAEQGRVPIRREPVDVSDVLEAVAERFRPRAELEGRSVSVEPGDPLVVIGDRLLLEQALGNLVDNAFHHGAGAVRLSASRQNGSAELHVLDGGKGFPPGFLHRAFEPFSRAQKVDTDGSGLGLAIVQTIADAHDGTARAANGDHGGTDVWITLSLDGSTRVP